MTAAVSIESVYLSVPFDKEPIVGKCAFNTVLLVEGVLLCFLLFFSCRHLLPAAPFFKVVARTGLEEERGWKELLGVGSG